MAISKAFFWFLTGAILAFFLLTSFTFVIFEKVNSDVVYPGIMVGNTDLGRHTQEEVAQIFAEKNENIQDSKITFSDGKNIATSSAKELGIGFNENLMAKQVISLGRSKNFLSNISIAFRAYFEGLYLNPSYYYSEEKLDETIKPIVEEINKNPSDALFKFENGKVIAFKPSEEGRMVNVDGIRKALNSQLEKIVSLRNKESIIIPIEVRVIQPEITTNEANDLGIKELIGKGTSFFSHSIPTRIFNIQLASSRINGVLISPGETFSFNKALGDVSSFTGYKQAYIIQNGRTILGDGGGVCQVSTTFFRTILDSGLPVTERRAHAYRVGYYEQASPPGIDATIYVPSVDLKFKNDTQNYILVQTEFEENLQQLTVFFYGTKDGRTVEMTEPIITSRTPPPPDLYQDDPALPKGTIKQVDYKAEGARVSFKRDVTKNGKKIISETFVSSYTPWQAVFLRGTKEN